MLKFSSANVKIATLSHVESLERYLPDGRKVYSFDLLSGWSCPFANQCRSKVVETNEGRRIKDGSETLFRCFSASQEVAFPNVYDSRKRNFDTLRSTTDPQKMTDAILSAMPKDLGICRIHVAGDFFSQCYFDAWVVVARSRPDILFYAYTKSLKYWVERIGSIPDNLVLTASHGGRLDDMISSNKLRSARVVYSVKEAKERGLEIDHDDSHAADPSKKSQDFALLIHGVQPAGSEASLAIKQLKLDGVKYSYPAK
jgi:hypothetical protein